MQAKAIRALLLLLSAVASTARLVSARRVWKQVQVYTMRTLVALLSFFAAIKTKNVAPSSSASSSSSSSSGATKAKQAIFHLNHRQRDLPSFSDELDD